MDSLAHVFEAKRVLQRSNCRSILVESRFFTSTLRIIIFSWDAAAIQGSILYYQQAEWILSTHRRVLFFLCGHRSAALRPYARNRIRSFKQQLHFYSSIFVFLQLGAITYAFASEALIKQQLHFPPPIVFLQLGALEL